MSGKKKSATKKTAQEIREMIACLEEALGFVECEHYSKREQAEADILAARINKIIGNPK